MSIEQHKRSRDHHVKAITVVPITRFLDADKRISFQLLNRILEDEPCHKASIPTITSKNDEANHEATCRP